MRKPNPDVIRARVDDSPGCVGISRGCKYVALHAVTDVGSRSFTIALKPGQARRLAKRLMLIAPVGAVRQ